MHVLMFFCLHRYIFQCKPACVAEMPECALCSGQSFDLMDGLYFCTQCGTQSQDVREEVHETVFEAFEGMLKVKQNKKSQKKVHDCGKPWFTLEGFQVVIKAQVEFLIKIGVDPALKNVIGQMWFSYVERFTNAFGTRKNKNFSQTTHSRDNPKNVMPTDSTYRKPPKQLSEAHLLEGDALELSSEIAREEFYEDDDPTGGLFEDGDQEENAEAKSHVGSVDEINENQAKSDSVKVMTLNHTLAFCFLGLLWLKEPICLSDLLRWAVEGHLPFFNATAYFPNYMKLSRADVLLYTRQRVPNKCTILTIASVLRRYIAVPDMPIHEINIYIARYATDLQLPASVHRYISSVINMMEMDMTELTGVFNYDDLAMAYIIISLRLIYGLDDVTEHELEVLATDITQDVNTYFPTWSDLMEKIRSSERMRVENGVPWHKDELPLLKDCRNYGKFCSEKIFGSWKVERTVRRTTLYVKGHKGLSSEKQGEYAKMFDAFLKDGKRDEESETSDKTPTSFPLLSARNTATEGISEDTLTRESATLVNTSPKGLSLDTVSGYYDLKTKKQKSEEDTRPTCQTHRNRYIRYDFPKSPLTSKRHETLRAKWWKEAVLPSSLRHLVEICSKLIYSEPAAVYNMIQMLEELMFEES